MKNFSNMRKFGDSGTLKNTSFKNIFQPTILCFVLNVFISTKWKHHYRNRFPRTIPSTRLLKHDFSSYDVEKKTRMNFHLTNVLWNKIRYRFMPWPTQHLYISSTWQISIEEGINEYVGTYWATFSIFNISKCKFIFQVIHLHWTCTFIGMHLKHSINEFRFTSLIAPKMWPWIILWIIFDFESINDWNHSIR